MGFNPYYPGIQSETETASAVVVNSLYSFNPYYPGIQSETQGMDPVKQPLLSVSILIILEFSQRQENILDELNEE